ncbi:uncharacterized protein VP01_3148g2 [Puccinia sorghi]|uniref:Uncharacterized protein n=1 Tax=Puccinia sorghi TaxID=27349 RepID=A0A0L6UZ41_9BASI|nr:uncharacterized protein VP01_3148g2 [Puccinia sorghi]
MEQHKNLLGLAFQALFHAPATVDMRKFKFSVDQQLESATAPSFSYITMFIQSASSKTKNCSIHVNWYIRMEINQAIAVHPQEKHYAPTHRRPVPHGHKKLENLLLNG